jgi:hypothetical protein
MTHPIADRVPRYGKPRKLKAGAVQPPKPVGYSPDRVRAYIEALCAREVAKPRPPPGIVPAPSAARVVAPEPAPAPPQIEQLSLPPGAPHPASTLVKKAIAAEFETTVDALLATCRMPRVTRPRMAAIWLHKQFMPAAHLHVIGNSFRNSDGTPRDHTTILNALRVINARLPWDEELAAKIERARQRVVDALTTLGIEAENESGPDSNPTPRGFRLMEGCAGPDPLNGGTRQCPPSINPTERRA